MRRSTPSVTAYREGPFLLRGPITLVDEDGEELCLRRDTIALCRCGRSKTKPLCDGSHAAVRSRATRTPPAPPA
jgi:CDGSH-type Zn-finger protein